MSYTNQELREFVRNSPWTDVSSFSNSWINYGSPYPAAGYRRVPGGMVQLKGLVRDGSAGTIFTLPADLRPGNDHIFSAATSPNGTTVRLDINSNGTVEVFSGFTTWVSLSHIIFPINA